MYQKPYLGLKEANEAVQAILAEALKDPDKPVAIAIVDDRGDLIYFVTMDRATPMFRHMALKKAYTSSRTGVDTLEFQKILRTRNLTATDFCSGNDLTTMQGGIAVTRDGITFGGIGVSGRNSAEDEELARIGLNSLKI